MLELGLRYFFLCHFFCSFFFPPRNRKEIKDWSGIMIDRMKDLKPLIVCFNGKGKGHAHSGDTFISIYVTMKTCESKNCTRI